jgi:hypothetical protein
MNDEGVLNKIEQLVAEEHVLLSSDEHARTADVHARLSAVEVELDRCWDLLRQRRARREFRQSPDDTSIRDPDTVEGYLQ